MSSSEQLSQVQNNTGDFRSCDAQVELFTNFRPSPFHTNTAVQKLHTDPPRFGHSSDINWLIVGTKSQQKDYLTGLLAASFFIFSALLVWAIILLLFKCLGPDRVGFLSARRKLPTKPPKPEALNLNEGIQDSGNDIGGVMNETMTDEEQEMTQQFNKQDEKKVTEQNTKIYKNGSSDALYDDDDAPSPTDKSSSEVLIEADRTILRQYELDLNEYEQQLQKRRRRIRRIRIGACFCSIGIMISAILFTVMTKDSFTTSFDLFEVGLQKANALIDQALTTTNKFIEEQANVQNKTKQFILQIKDLCPNSTQELCTNIDDEAATTLEERGCNFSSLPYGSELTELVDTFDTKLAEVLNHISNSQEDLLNIQELVYQAESYYPKHGKQIFWASTGTSLALGIVALLLTGGMVYMEMDQGQEPNQAERKLPKAFAFCRSWLLIPLLLLLVCSCWVLSMTFIIGGMGSADFCYNSPEDPLLNILERIEDRFDSMVYFFLRYYISGCPASDVPKDLELAVHAIQEIVLPAITNLVDEIQTQGQENLEAACGAGLGPFLVIIESLGTQLCIMAETLVSLGALMACGNWFPLYSVTMYEAICQYATQGFTWAAWTQLFIVMLSFVLLTLRVSFYELEEVHDDDTLLIPAILLPKGEGIVEQTVTQPKEPPAESGILDDQIEKIPPGQQVATSPTTTLTVGSNLPAASPELKEVSPTLNHNTETCGN